MKRNRPSVVKLVHTVMDTTEHEREKARWQIVVGSQKLSHFFVWWPCSIFSYSGWTLSTLPIRTTRRTNVCTCMHSLTLCIHTLTLNEWGRKREEEMHESWTPCWAWARKIFSICHFPAHIIKRGLSLMKVCVCLLCSFYSDGCS